MSNFLALYCIVGGIPEEVDEKVLHAAFIPFGDIMDIQIPLDYETGLQSWHSIYSHVAFILFICFYYAFHVKFVLCLEVFHCLLSQASTL